jgi:hypothetical protein
MAQNRCDHIIALIDEVLGTPAGPPDCAYETDRAGGGAEASVGAVGADA